MPGPTIHWIDGFVGGVSAPGRKNGAKVEEIISHMPQVKDQLASTATRAGAKARSLLAVAQANVPGSSTWIATEQHDLDWSVRLYASKPPSKNQRSGDNAGVIAATSIEFGHTGMGAAGAIAPFQVRGKRYPGQFILHRAFGMKRS